MSNFLPLRALFRFHWSAGARVALRANALTLGIVIFVFGNAPDGLPTLRHFVLGVVSTVGGSGRGQRILLAAIATALAMTAVPRVSLGGSGWLRSLPFDRRASWRAAVAAAAAAQIAIVAFVVLATGASALVYGAALSWAKITTVPLMVVSVAATVIPAKNPVGRVIAAAAVWATIAGTWVYAFAALALLPLADLLGGGMPTSRRKRQRAHRASTVSGGPPATWIWIRMTWRGIGMRRSVDSVLIPAVATAFAYFITRNNPEFALHPNTTVIRVCGGVALATFIAGLANAVFVARQPWAWARSLPWSSRARVIADACLLGVPLWLVPIALLPLDVVSALVVAAQIPLVAAVGATSLRGVGARQTGAAGEAFVLSLVTGVVVGVWPAASLIALGLAPLVIRWGAARERAWHVTRWTELHHNAAGDPTWLTTP